MSDRALAIALADKLDRLKRELSGLESALLAFSGGVDSSFLLRVAHDVLGERLTALTSVSPTNPEADTAQAVDLARSLGVRHVIVESNELEVPGYAANPINRCYLCKDRLYEICAGEARQRGIAVIVDGVNVDDLGDYRPGLRAADEYGVRHPLVEANLRKSELRELSRTLGLATWDRPASPCLSSRFPYGTEITGERLRMVAQAEDALQRLGFREVRVRFHGDVARIEVGRDELARLLDREVRADAAQAVRGAGFRYVTVDLDGFRSGSLNAAVVNEDRRR
jgi:pyridinium-3,5-biscarboxylic acid mononucleotide sulfurtransferase